MLLSHDKLTELDVIVDDDEGWVTIIFVITVDFSVELGVGVLDPSGDGDLVRQCLNHKSGVIRFSKMKMETN